MGLLGMTMPGMGGDEDAEQPREQQGRKKKRKLPGLPGGITF
jgi:hypothetical protein